MLYEADGGNQRDSFNLLGLDANVIATTRGTGSSEAWYLYNKETRGSTSSLIDDGGTVAVAYEYDAFGNTTIRTGEAFDNEICYTGQVYDKETGLYYYNARFYDPEGGRFLTQDTYRGEQIEPGTWHLYVYCANNPVNYVDPSGHLVVTTWKKYNKKVIYNYWKKAISPWAKVKECKQIDITNKRTISATVSASLGATAKKVSVQVGLSANVSHEWTSTIQLKVNQKSKKKYVRAVLKADAYRWRIKKTQVYVYGRKGRRKKVTKGYLHRYKSGTVSYELEYSNRKHA